MTERLMPDPWFRGQTSARTIGELIRPPVNADMRDLLDGERRLGRFILPPFQRPPVWSMHQQVRLIESLWAGLPIGAYVWNELDHMSGPDMWLLDGQQRITALLRYGQGDYRVHGYRYPDLPRQEQRRFENQSIAGVMTRIDSEAECREVYDRLAYGGTAHAPVPA